MIAGKIILTALTIQDNSLLQPSSLKFNLIMNDLLYDELDVNHHKYFCVTNGDTLTLEVV